MLLSTEFEKHRQDLDELRKNLHAHEDAEPVCWEVSGRNVDSANYFALQITQMLLKIKRCYRRVVLDKIKSITFTTIQ